MVLVQRDPWHDFRRGFRGFDRFFSGFDIDRPRTRLVGNIRTGNLALDVADQDEQFVVMASLPGLKPDDVDISITDRIVTVTADSEDSTQTADDDKYVLRERHHGKLSRSVLLPAEVDADKALAEHRDGVLTLTLPKTIVERTKRIPVSAG
jgi:HSP20 family protein